MKMASHNLTKHLNNKNNKTLTGTECNTYRVRDTYKTSAIISEEPVPHVRQTKQHDNIKVEVKGINRRM